MTLVGTSEHVLPMMMNVQQQHQRHQQMAHQRGNVIVDPKVAGLLHHPPQHQQQHQQQQAQCGPGPVMHCKKSKYVSQAGPYNNSLPHQPASVARRNARERNRVKQVNNGFQELRERIPQSVAQALGGNTQGTQGAGRAGSKKLSKVETLRMAVEYIRSLQRLLEDNDAGIPVNNPEAGLHYSSSSSPSHHPRQSSPTCFGPSEASSSPTPSFVSEASSVGSQGYGSSGSALYTINSGSGEYYEPMTPEDEELLDVISMWQQNQ